MGITCIYCCHSHHTFLVVVPVSFFISVLYFFQANNVMNAPNDSNIKFFKELFLVHSGEESFFFSNHQWNDSNCRKR